MTVTEAAARAPAWVMCRRCGDLLYGKRFARGSSVCPGCGYHAPVPAPERLAQLLDQGSWTPLAVASVTVDPLGFVDTKPYGRRLSDARARTGLDEAVVCVHGAIGGQDVVAAVMDFRFMGGSLGAGVGERVTAAGEEALSRRVPLIVVTASGGARMQEGALSLMQMVKTSQTFGRLDEAGILTIAIVTDPTYGGVAASFANLADVILAEPGARLGFAGPRVIEQTIGRPLPEGFQSAEFLMDHGLVDDIVARPQLRSTLTRLLTAGRPRTADGAGPSRVGDAVVEDPVALPVRTAWDVVRTARHAGRPTCADYVAHLFDGFLELHGDRMSSDCPALMGGIGLLQGRPVVLVAHHKGHTTSELIRHNFGMPSPAGYRKAARLLRLAAKLGLPVVTLIDTPGAHPGPEAEAAGQAGAIAENIRLMAGLPVPVVAIVTGEGGSGGALALGVANRVLVLENGIYSVISPEGCAAILWHSPAAAPQAAAALQLTAPDLLRAGIVDAVVREPEGGAHMDHPQAADALGRSVQWALDGLAGQRGDQLVEHRRARFRRFGVEGASDGGGSAGR